MLSSYRGAVNSSVLISRPSAGLRGSSVEILITCDSSPSLQLLPLSTGRIGERITVILCVITDTSLLRGSWAKRCGSSGEPFERLPMEISFLRPVDQGEWQHVVILSLQLHISKSFSSFL